MNVRLLCHYLLLLVLLAHDLLMASAALAASSPATPVAHHAHQPSPRALIESADESPLHPEACGIGEQAVAPVVAFAGRVILPSSAADVTARVVNSLLHPPGWEPPRWPPGTRRAMLQVYRL